MLALSVPFDKAVPPEYITYVLWSLCPYLIFKPSTTSYKAQTSRLTQALRFDNVHPVTLPRNNVSCTCPLGISRPNRLRNMSSGLFGCSDGVLLCGQLHMGRYARGYRSSDHYRVQYCFWYLSKCMCSRITGSNAMKGAAVCVPCTTFAD